MRYALGIGVLVLLAVGVDSAPAGDKQVKPSASGQQQALPPGAAVPLEIPAQARARKNPVAPTAESVERGARLFSSQCAMCHGVRGDGAGDLAGTLKIRMPDMTDPAHQKTRTDGELFYVLTHGHGRMPGEGDRLAEEWKWDLVNYIRTLPAAARSAAAGHE